MCSKLRLFWPKITCYVTNGYGMSTKIFIILHLSSLTTSTVSRLVAWFTDINSLVCVFCSNNKLFESVYQAIGWGFSINYGVVIFSGDSLRHRFSQNPQGDNIPSPFPFLVPAPQNYPLYRPACCQLILLFNCKGWFNTPPSRGEVYSPELGKLFGPQIPTPGSLFT